MDINCDGLSLTFSRTTMAADHNYYTLIDRMFSREREGPLNLTQLDAMASNITMMDLYEDAGHDKHDMIVR